MLDARIEAFVNYASTLTGHVNDRLAASLSTRYIHVPDAKPKASPLKVNIENNSDKTENYLFWIME